MNTSGFSVALILLPLAFPLAVRAAEPTGAPPGNIVATKLDTNHRVGDRYSYRTMDLYSKVEDRQYTMRVTGIADGQVIFGNGGRITDLLGNDIKLGNGNQFSGQQIYVPEYGVGKRWSTKYQFKRHDGAEFIVTYDFKVVAREQISVPAGTFDTYRVEGGGYMHQMSGHRGSACAERHSIFKIWIAPDQVRRYIAQDYIQEGAALGCKKYVTTRTELVSYRLGDRAGGAEVPETAGLADFVPQSAHVEEPPNDASRD